MSIFDLSCLCILEVKDCTPYGWKSPLSRYEMLSICEQGDMVSIHTSELWGGSWKWLEEARRLTEKPILAKGFHSTNADVSRAFACGADNVLTVGWWDGDPCCWHECESLDELSQTKAPMAVWNSRNPRTGQNREETIEQAREVRPGWLCQASGILQHSDVGNVDAVLIGCGLYPPYNQQKERNEK